MSKFSLPNRLLGKKVIITDFDGTLVTLELNWEKLKKIFFSQLEMLYGFKYKSLKQAINSYKRSPRTKAKILDNLLGSLEVGNLISYTGNKNLLDYIKNDQKKIYIIYSSNSKALIEYVLGEMGILNCFEFIISLNNVQHLKPHIEGMNIILSLNAGFSKSDFVMLGNSIEDEQVASLTKIDYLKIH